jgi:hypothetical protein
MRHITRISLCVGERELATLSRLACSKPLLPLLPPTVKLSQASDVPQVDVDSLRLNFCCQRGSQVLSMLVHHNLAF